MYDRIKEVIAKEMLLAEKEALTHQYNAEYPEVNCSDDQKIIPAVHSAKNADGSMTSKPIEDMYPTLERKEFFNEMIVPPLSDNNS